MKFLLAVILVGSATAFSPLLTFGVTSRVSLPCLFAKHAQDKGAKWARSKRPKKTRKSDIIRAPTNYPAFEKPAEYTIIMEDGEIPLSKVVLPCARTPSKRLTRKEKIAQGN